MTDLEAMILTLFYSFSATVIVAFVVTVWSEIRDEMRHMEK